MSATVALIEPFFKDHLPLFLERIGVPVEVQTAATAKDADVIPLLGSAEIVLTTHWNAALGSAAGKLRFMQLLAAGWEKILPATIPAGVVVANCYEHERAVAEYVMMMCLAHSRKLVVADRALRQGDWKYSSVGGYPPHPELGERTIGIIGLGRIGRAVANLAAAFDMRRVGIDMFDVPAALRESLGLAWAGGPQDLGRLLAESDFVVLSLPMTEQTRGMLGARELHLCKPGAVLINPARAEIIDQHALYDALVDGTLAGASLDTWWHYPMTEPDKGPADLPFAQLDNVIMSPHIAGVTANTVLRRMQVAGDNVGRFLRGERPANTVAELSRA